MRYHMLPCKYRSDNSHLGGVVAAGAAVAVVVLVVAVVLAVVMPIPLLLPTLLFTFSLIGLLLPKDIADLLPSYNEGIVVVIFLRTISSLLAVVFASHATYTLVLLSFERAI